MSTIKVEIKNRWTGAVLYTAEIPADTESGLHMRAALETATTADADLCGAYLRGADLCGADLCGAYLCGADLRGADLRDADLRGADLCGADLRGADLRDADLRDADLRGADLRGADGEPLPRATPEQAIENLDRVRAIILDDKERLNMGHWHGDNDWRDRTCAEETLCGTTHCLAGWLQVCSTEPKLRQIDAQLAGVLAAPIAAKMFFRSDDEAIDWLEKRKYVEETAEAERRAAERKAKREATGGTTQ